MKVYRIDYDWGEYDTLTELEMNTQYTKEEIEELKKSDRHFLIETPYTVRQLNRSRRLHRDEEYTYNFEEEYGIAPDVYDILKQEYS